MVEADIAISSSTQNLQVAFKIQKCFEIVLYSHTGNRKYLVSTIDSMLPAILVLSTNYGTMYIVLLHT